MTPAPSSNVAPLDIGPVQLAGRDGVWRVSAMVEGHEVWFESDVPLRPSPEAFLAAFLFPAMAGGRSLRTDDAVCETWVTNIEEARRIARRYWDLGSGDVLAPRTTVPRESEATGVFFTGGVDSFHSLLINRDIVRALIFVEGFDIKLTDTDRLRKTRELMDHVADALNLSVFRIRTNLRSHHAFDAQSWGRLTHGEALGAVSQLLAPHLGQVLIASSDVAPPHGSTVELDRCWSSGPVAVATGGPGVPRIEKVAAIAHEPLVHSHLRVCWENRSSDLNCGECEKCVRTQVQFAAAGVLDKLTCFGPIDLPTRIRNLWAIPPHLAGQWVDAQRALGSPELRWAVRGLRYRTRRHRVGDVVMRVLRGPPQ